MCRLRPTIFFPASNPLALAIEHKFDVVDRLEQEPACQFSKPAIDRLPGTEMDRQHAPTTARADQIAHGVHHLAKVHFTWTPSTPRLGHQRCQAIPLLVGQIARIALRLSGNLGHPPPALLRPHAKPESATRQLRNPQLIFQTASYMLPVDTECLDCGRPGLGRNPASLRDLHQEPKPLSVPRHAGAEPTREHPDGFVFTRSPGFLGISDEATTMHSWPSDRDQPIETIAGRAGLVAEMHTIELSGDPLDNAAAHARI